MAFKEACVTVFQVLTPVSFMIKETPGAAMSPSGRAFLFLEARLRMLYTDGAATPVSPLPPPVGSIVLGMKPEDGQWNRVRVNRIFETREGYQAQVTLVDFGEKRIVPCSALCEVPSEEFLEVPFQCVRFSLRGLKKRGQSTDGQGAGAGNDDAWDAAALEFVETALDSKLGTEHSQCF